MSQGGPPANYLPTQLLLTPLNSPKWPNHLKRAVGGVLSSGAEKTVTTTTVLALPLHPTIQTDASIFGNERPTFFAIKVGSVCVAKIYFLSCSALALS